MPVDKKKHTCKKCGKSIVRLSQHLYAVHNISLSVTEPTDLRDFIKLCTHLPIPPGLWSTLMGEKFNAIEKYLQGKADLPPELFQSLYNLFQEYNESKTKLILATKVKVGFK